MKSTRTTRAGLGLAAGFAAVCAAGATARAVVTEPNGLMGPIPVGPTEIGLAAGFNPPSTVTLSALFTARGENIDWLQDARTSPQVFSPQCAFTGELVLHGGACHIDFGWYNVDPNRTTPVPESEIYTIIPGTNPPMGPPWMPWHPGVGETGPSFSTESIRADPNYKGGLIGFALRGDTGQDCKQTHFSEQKLNPNCTGGACAATPGHWYAAVIWQSTKTPNAYYMGFEDLPFGESSTSMSDFGSIPGQGLKSDGDFNDFVYFISGLTCEGGGTACDTGMPGVCGAGLNECVTGTTLKCKQSVKAGAEVCDGLDNDCNGMTDDGAKCPDTQVCDRGRCLPQCGTSEFPCGSGDVCQNGLCIEAKCAGKTCDAGTVCKAGKCVAPCDGVTCPATQVCRLNRCVDPCDGVTCGADRVCQGGVCVPSCKCSGCGAGKACAASGLCVESTCADKTCGAGEVCQGGACADACQGAVCPHGQECKAGQCSDIPKPDGGVSSTFDGGAILGAGGSGSTTGAAGASGGPGSGGTGGGSVDPNEKITPASGCRCDAGGASGGAGVALLGIALVAARRRRRR
jgi:MYXO-CTERM domain-containing protein